MAKKWFRVAREGGTVDNREIKANDLQNMADNYDTEIYGARINKEHIRGFFLEDQFGAFGDVLALKTEKDKTGKLCLLAQLDPTKELVELNKKRQKVYTSVEMGIVPEFDGVYLTGLAVTDSPASTGTSMLHFSAQKSQSFSMVVKDTEGKDQTLNFKTTAGDWSDHYETEFDFSEDSSAITGFLEKFSNLLDGCSEKQSKRPDNDGKDGGDDTNIATALEFVAQSQADLLEKSESFVYSENFAALQEDYDNLQNDFNELKKALEEQPSFNYSARPPADGDSANLAQC